jgi:hypothetical protein
VTPDHDTGRLRVEQLRRELAERHLAESGGEPEEAAQHARRAEKAGYLRSKLEARERSEREAERTAESAGGDGRPAEAG